jgi:hypothetical protein
MKNDNGVRRILLWSVGLAIFVAPVARAQGTSGLAPSVNLTVPWLLPREPTDSIGLSPWAGSGSRLSFQGGVPHQIDGVFVNCVSLEKPAGSAVRFPAQRFTPARLILEGFSSAQCPVRVQGDPWIDLTDELHGGSPLRAGGRMQKISFGGAPW